MAMTKETLQYLVEELGPTAVETLELDGHTYVSTTSARMVKIPPAEPVASTLTVSTLHSLVRYLEEAGDQHDLTKCALLVEGPTQVSLLGPLEGRHRQREIAIAAVAAVPKFDFGRYQGQEEFLIGLRSCFVDPDERSGGDPENLLREVVRVCSRLSSRSEVRTTDDGLGQSASIMAGTETLEEVDIPNPVALRARRTFPEVEQPLSSYLLRLREGPSVALFEADGGAWKLAAAKAVAEWLQTAIQSAGVQLGTGERPAILY